MHRKSKFGLVADGSRSFSRAPLVSNLACCWEPLSGTSCQAVLLRGQVFLHSYVSDLANLLSPMHHRKEHKCATLAADSSDNISRCRSDV